MTRGIYTKWIIGAAFVLLIVATGCILYYQHTTAQYKHEAEQADKLLQQWKADKAKTTTIAKKKKKLTPLRKAHRTPQRNQQPIQHRITKP